ncbi:Mitochondrial inner membrane protease atp23-like protein [Elsinoe fawcettii]|nr:Mitochondrial inner membrane protease atp23-like protein [Elsinoe fawcettii]
MSSDSPSLPADTKPVPDKDFYNWSTFFSLLTGRATPREADAYLRVRDDMHEASDCKTCEERTAWLLKYSPIIRFLRQNINLLGQDINETNIHCRRCTTAQSGGFDPEYGILICANQLRNRGHQEDTMAHEMVHAWDFLRFKYNDPKDLRHAACTESFDVVGRVQVWERVLHERAEEYHTADAGVCTKKSDVVGDAATVVQGSGTCGQGGE